MAGVVFFSSLKDGRGACGRMLCFGSWVNNRRCVALFDVLDGRPGTERMRLRFCASDFWEINRFRLHAG